MKNIFNGFDYSELYNKWGLYVPDGWGEDSELFQLYINNFLLNRADDSYDKLNRVSAAFVKDCRLYLKACSEWEIGYEHVVWKALCEIEDDFTFMRLFYPLIGYMWN